MKTEIKLLSVFFLLGMTFNVGAQKLELIHTFPYDDKAFTYVEKWDANEGVPGGPRGPRFLNSRFMRVGSSDGNTTDIYDLKAMNIVQTINSSSGGSLFQNVSKWFMGTAVNNRFLSYSTNQKPPFEFRHIPIKFPTKIDNNPDGYTLLASGRMVFAKGLKQGTVYSWELLDNDQVQYRDDVATAQWLATNGAQFGYKELEGGVIFFGENRLEDTTFLTSVLRQLGYTSFWMLKETDPFPTEIELQNSGYHPFGRDSKGLEYRYKNVEVPFKTSDTLVGSQERRYMILDPWSRQVIYRTLPVGQWLYLMGRAENGYLYPLGGYGQGVHPSGDIYMFSANKRDGAFDLKRMKNDWWAELGADKKVVGRILGNHIPLRVEPNESAEVVAYNYENEYVWIQEESRRAAKYEGQATVWAKVQKLTGAVGWMPRAPIVLQD